MNNVFVKSFNQYVTSNQKEITRLLKKEIFEIVKIFNQYVTSKQKEITKLLKKEIFEIVNQQDILSNTRIFNFRFVDEIKHSDTNIQNAKLYLRDITQAYVQISSELDHFYIRFAEKLIKMLDVDHNFFLKHSLIQHQVQTCDNSVLAAEFYAIRS